MERDERGLIKAPNQERIERFFADTRDERPFIDGKRRRAPTPPENPQ